MKIIVALIALLSTAALSGAPETTPVPSNRPLYLHFMTPNPGSKPPERILSTRVVLSQDIFVATGNYGDSLTGRVETHGDKFFVSVRGSFGSSSGDFAGEVELDKPFQPTSYAFSGGIFITRFVLSASSDCSSYLKVSETRSK